MYAFNYTMNESFTYDGEMCIKAVHEFAKVYAHTFVLMAMHLR
jgi:hypothetical protein